VTQRKCTKAVVRLAPLLLVGLVAACSSSGSTSSSEAPEPLSRSTPEIDPGFRLAALTKPEQGACRRLASTKPMTVLCPTRLPRPEAASPPTPIGVYTFHVCHAEGRKPGCPLYDLAVLYGVPSRSAGNAAKDTPSRFLHFEMLGGRYVPDALGVHSLSGTRPLQRLIGTRMIPLQPRRRPVRQPLHLHLATGIMELRRQPPLLETPHNRAEGARRHHQPHRRRSPVTRIAPPAAAAATQAQPPPLG
jgi:hypothetical protein